MAFVGWRKFWCFYHYSPKCIFTCGLFPQDMLVTGAVAVGGYRLQLYVPPRHKAVAMPHEALPAL